MTDTAVDTGLPSFPGTFVKLCFTCGNQFRAALCNAIYHATQPESCGGGGRSLKSLLDEHRILRFCCRGAFLGRSLDDHMATLQAERERQARLMRLRHAPGDRDTGGAGDRDEVDGEAGLVEGDDDAGVDEST